MDAVTRRLISMAMMSGSERMSMACMTARYLMHWKTPRLRTVPLMGIGNSGSRLSRNTVPGTAARRIRLEGKRSTQRAERAKARGIPARRGETAQRARQGCPAAKRRAQGTPTKDGLPVRAGRQLNSPNELRANGLVEESAYPVTPSRQPEGASPAESHRAFQGARVVGRESPLAPPAIHSEPKLADRPPYPGNR